MPGSYLGTKAILSDPRVTIRIPGPPHSDDRCILYWMRRAQRAFDNPALETAIALANEIKRPVRVLFFLRTSIPHASLRHSTFMLEGLIDTAKRLRDRGIDFIMRHAKYRPADEFGRFCEEVSPTPDLWQNPSHVGGQHRT